MTVTVETEHELDTTNGSAQPDAIIEDAAEARQDGTRHEADGDPQPTKELTLADPALNGTVVDDAPLQEHPLISVTRLTPHPDYVGDDRAPDEEMIASIKELGVKDPVSIVPNPDKPGDAWIIDGLRKWLGARLAGRTHIPYSFDPTLADDRGAQNLAAWLANDASMVKTKNPFDQLKILHLAEKGGKTRTELRKATGKTRTQLKAELDAGAQLLQHSETVTGMLAEVTPGDQYDEDGPTPIEWDLDEAIRIAPFADDPDALNMIAEYKRGGTDIGYALRRLEEQRTQQAAYDQTVAELTAAGTPVIETVPDGILRLDMLLTGTGEDAEPMTVEGHAACPGRCATVKRDFWNSMVVTHYCDDPHSHGHRYATPFISERMARRAELLTNGRTVTFGIPHTATALTSLRQDGQPITAEKHHACPGSAVGLDGNNNAVEYCADPQAHGHTLVQLSRPESKPESKKDDGPPMMLRREGRKAWKAAAETRLEWLESYLRGKKSAPAPMRSFLLLMFTKLPSGVHDAITYDSDTLFTRLAGRDSDKVKQEWDKLNDARRTVLAFARLVAAFEHQLFGDTYRDYAWRMDRSNPYISRELAGLYFRVLMDLGHKAPPIERAVAAGVEYLGDNIPLPTDNISDVDEDPEDPDSGDGPTGEEPTVVLAASVSAPATDAGETEENETAAPDTEAGRPDLVAA